MTELFYLENLVYFIVVGVICLIMGWMLRGALSSSRVYIAQEENEKTVKALKNSESQISSANQLLEKERAGHRAEQEKLMERIDQLKQYKKSSLSSDSSMDALQAQFDTYKDRKENELARLQEQVNTSESADADTQLGDAIAERDQLRSELSWETRQKESAITRFQEQLRQLENLRIENQEVGRKLTRQQEQNHQQTEQKGAEVDALKQRVKELENASGDDAFAERSAEDAMNALNADVERLKAERDRQNETLLNRDDELDKLRADVRARNESLEVKLSEIDGLNQSLQEKERALKEASANASRNAAIQNTAETVELKNKLDGLQDRLTQAEQDKLGLEHELTLSQSQVDEMLPLRGSVAHQEASIERLEKHNKELETALTKAEHQLENFDDTKEENELKQISLKNLEATNETLSADIASAQRRIEELENVETVLAVRTAELQENENERQRLSEENVRIAALEDQINDLQPLAEKDGENRQAIEKLEDEKQLLNTSLADAERRLTGFDKLRDELIRRDENLMAASKQQELDKAQQQAEVNVLREQIDGLQTLKSDVEDKDEKIQALENERDALAQEFETHKTNSEHSLAEIKTSLQTRETETQKLNSEIDGLKLLNQDARANEKKLAETTTDLESERQKHENTVEKNRNEIKTLNVEINTLKDQISDQAGNLDEDKQQLAEREQTIEELKAQIETANSKKTNAETRLASLESLRDKISKRDDQITELMKQTTELEDVQRENRTLKDKASNSDKLETKLERRRSEIEDLQKHNDELRNEVSSLKSKADKDNNDAELEKLRSELAKSKEKADELEARLASEGSGQQNLSLNNTQADGESVDDLRNKLSNREFRIRELERTLSQRGDKDDLKLIKGIGPKIEGMLNELGISTFKQIADLTEADIKSVSKKLSFSGRIQRDDWIGKARDQHERKYG